MTAPWVVGSLAEGALGRLAEVLALKVRVGDTIALHGDLGAGKTTLARALVRALLDDDAAEIPSPTFALVQTYATPRLAVAHFDLYRLGGPDELAETGLEDAAATGLVLVEWPERAGDELAPDRLDVYLSAGDDPATRSLAIHAGASWTIRLERVREILAFLDRVAPDATAIRYLQGDASPRAYARLATGGAPRVLMDSPHMTDGPPVRDGKPYSQIAHIAEDVRAFCAVAGLLSDRGVTVPRVHAQDLDAGLLIVDDLGDTTFGDALAAGGDMSELWTAALDVLVALRTGPPPAVLPIPGSSQTYALPAFDAGALAIETELLVDWYWPAVKGAPASPAIRAEFAALWGALIARVTALPEGLVLRDFHSPNLMWRRDAQGLARVGVIDFQDAMRGPWGYDVVSLLQDARLDVPEDVEERLRARYVAAMRARDPAFDEAAFTFAHAVLGAQRGTKLLGIFARLARRDGKPRYLAHLPRTWRYLERNLAHPALAPYAAWLARHFPPEVRRAAQAG